MKLCISITLLHLVIASNVQCARILAVFPFPSISHQVVFRKVTQELVKRGHEVTVVTTDPMYQKGQAPSSLREIDIHDVSYNAWQSFMKENYSASRDNLSFSEMQRMSLLLMHIFDKQLQTPEMQELLFRKKPQFDLLLLEAVMRPSIGLSHIFKVPVIQISSLGTIFDNNEVLGLLSHPILYPSNMNRRIYNLTTWEKFEELYHYYRFKYILHLNEAIESNMLQKHLGSDMPSISDLYNNVHMLFLNIHPIWADNQPVPQSVVFMGGIHQQESKPLPQDLQKFLDSSKHGVIYVSFGTNVLAGMIPPKMQENLVKVLSQLPYDVLWKWDKDELRGKSENIKISKWLPQADLLKHPKVKAFVTQAGLQSTDEAITAGVPLVAFPMLGDQWYNAEKYVLHGIGIKLTFDDFTEDMFKKSIESVINDKSYRDNIKKLREVMLDQPQTPLERTMWWIEHLLRHGGAKHLRAAGANIPWTQYYEIELIAIVFGVILVTFILFILGVIFIYKFLKSVVYKNKNKLKRS